MKPFYQNIKWTITKEVKHYFIKLINEDLDRVMFLIPTGRGDFMVVFDDAYEETTGQTKILTKEQIEKQYKIKIEW